MYYCKTGYFCNDLASSTSIYLSIFSFLETCTTNNMHLFLLPCFSCIVVINLTEMGFFLPYNTLFVPFSSKNSNFFPSNLPWSSVSTTNPCPIICHTPPMKTHSSGFLWACHLAQMHSTLPNDSIVSKKEE